ncbi:MAG: sensor histidine kinase [bacterium]
MMKGPAARTVRPLGSAEAWRRDAGGMRRRLDLIILAHIWALGPLALLWFLVPAWRGPGAPPSSATLAAIAGLAVAYLLVRTWSNIRTTMVRANTVWPYIDILFITAALIVVGNPTDHLAALYFIPLASAVATLSVSHLAALAVATAGAYALVIIVTGFPWSLGLVYRVLVIGVMASLYGWVIRMVTAYERTTERAEFQRDLAAEIHDGIQHHLITLGARLDLAHRLLTEAPGRAGQILVQEREAARRAADELRYLVRRLRTGAFRRDDLAAALRQQVAALAERWPFALELEVPPTLPRMPPAAEHSLLRAIQESLTNVAKHAQADQAEVRLSVTDGAVRCVIRDEGVGFSPAETLGDGLAGLRDRIQALGGTLEVTSAPGEGTTVTVLLPLRQAA